VDASDATLPDLRLGESAKTQGALVVINGTSEWQKTLRVVTTSPDGRKTTLLMPTVPPLGVRKVAFSITAPAPKTADAQKFSVHLTDAKGKMLASPTEISLRVRRPNETYKRTFISEIDGSVQYYAVNPMTPDRSSNTAPALVLSLHGASVEAIGQADAYASKSWAHLVAPTNRRPYGFDWEEWGRLDALEVLKLAQAELKTDPARTYLTGHSMGGHGTWQVGVQYPDRFAAIAPSAGWISFFSYAGSNRNANPSPMEAMLQRATNPSDTLALSRNYTNQSIYILHGGADDNVPPTEARTMSSHLATYHKDFQYHEQPGAGHWWSEGDEPGARCVDYPAFFDLFAKRRLPDPAEVRRVEFATANPEISSRCHWVRIDQQEHPLEISSVNLTLEPHLRRFAGTTKNVRRIQFDTRAVIGKEPITIELDGIKLDKLPLPANHLLTFVKDGATWKPEQTAPIGQKSAVRSGTFKGAFNHRFQFVVGTKGTPEENEWALAKARFDAETFWYRGNGSVDIVLDTDFNPKKEPHRGVILYGNADTNAAWSALLPDVPEINVRRGGMHIGRDQMLGENLAVLYVRPRPNSDTACVGVVSGTGLVGMRLADRIPIFLAGVGVPDCVVMAPEVLTNGVSGVKAAGFFGNDWTTHAGEWVMDVKR
jgi:poly(3-hydroxybutyrate) depolymerase